MTTPLLLTPDITKLFQALEKEDFAEATELLQKIGDLNPYRDSGFPPLHWAAYKGRIKVLFFLLDHGVDVDLRDCDGKTALHVAAAMNQIVVADLLLKRGGAIHAVETSTGRKPLDYAVLCEQKDTALHLIRKAATVTRHIEKHSRCRHHDLVKIN